MQSIFAWLQNTVPFPSPRASPEAMVVKQARTELHETVLCLLRFVFLRPIVLRATARFGKSPACLGEVGFCLGV